MKRVNVQDGEKAKIFKIEGALTKSQLISECLFGVLNFQKTNEKFDKFLP